MMRNQTLEHRFVDQFPETLEDGLLYVSLAYGSAAHKCCCGCGEEIVTPMTPTDWRITYDGETISLSPSVGSWALSCRSHYIIDRGRVIEALPWSEHAIEAERKRDRRAKELYYEQATLEKTADKVDVDKECGSMPYVTPEVDTRSMLYAAFDKLRFWKHD